MSDRLPHISLPAGMVRQLTPAECEAEVEKTLDRLERCIHQPTRRFLQRELRGWQRLAAERDAS